MQGCWRAAAGCLCRRTIGTAGMLGAKQTGAMVGLRPGRREGWGILEEEREHFWPLIGYKSRSVVLGLEGDVEAGSKSGPSERKLR